MSTLIGYEFYYQGRKIIGRNKWEVFQSPSGQQYSKNLWIEWVTRGFKQYEGWITNEERFAKKVIAAKETNSSARIDIRFSSAKGQGIYNGHRKRPLLRFIEIVAVTDKVKRIRYQK